MSTLTETQRQVLDYAADHGGRISWFPDNVKGGARKKVIEGLCNKAFITEISPDNTITSDWFISLGGYDALGRIPTAMATTYPDPDIEAALVATEAQWVAEKEVATEQVVGQETQQEAGQDHPQEAQQDDAQQVVQPDTLGDALVDAPKDPLVDAQKTSPLDEQQEPSQDQQQDTQDDAKKEPPQATSQDAQQDSQEDPKNKPRIRENTKQALVIAMLQRPEGATITQLCEATGWLSHTVRGAFAGALKKKLGLIITSDKPDGGERIYRI